MDDFVWEEKWYPERESDKGEPADMRGCPLSSFLSFGNKSDALWTLTPYKKGSLLQAMTNRRETGALGK